MINEKLVIEELNKLDKDKLIDLCLQYKWESMMYEQTQNQKAIECLKDVKNNFIISENGYGDTIVERGKNGLTFLEYIDNKIKELEEGK